MTTEQQAAFIVALKGAFAGDLGPERAQELMRYCGVWRPDDARSAIDRLVSDGCRWQPTPGELLAALERARGGRGSWEAKAALAGMTPEEYGVFRREEAREAVARRRRRELTDGVSGRVRASR